MYIFNFYSLLNASTGSFLLAIFAGINPAITVSNTLIIINTIAPTAGRDAILLIPTTFFIIMFIGMFKRSVTTIQSTPALSPSIKVSALNTREMSFLLAPIALSIPISLVLSITEI